MGSIRGAEDQKLLDDLKELAGDNKQIEFRVNLKHADIVDLFSRAKVGIHTMREEHFGISIVEMMASGLVTIAHKSGGPKSDIIGRTDDLVGYLADDKEGYKQRLLTAFDLSLIHI